MQRGPFKKKQLQVLNQLDVCSIYLFGSRAMGLEHERSDFDYAVLARPGHSKGDELYEALYPLLAEISKRSLENDVIDIVFLRDCNLELRFHVVSYGKVIYDQNPTQRLEFESQTTLLYCDYKPILNEFDAQLLNSL